MKTRLILALVAVLLLACALAAWFEPGGRLAGWRRGEAFFAGHPASWWASRIRVGDPVAQDEALRRLRDGGEKAVPVAVAILRGPADGWAGSESRWRAAELLGEIGKDNFLAVSALSDAVRDDDPLVRPVAIRSLGQLAPADEEAIPVLIEAMQGPNRRDAVEALSRFRGQADVAVAGMTPFLADEDEILRWTTARALGRIGKKAAPAVPALVKMLRLDDHPLCREHAAQSLGRIGRPDDEVIAALAMRLSDPNTLVRHKAVRSLGQFGPAARAALEQVRQATKDSEPSVAREARKAVLLIAPKEPAKVPKT